MGKHFKYTKKEKIKEQVKDILLAILLIGTYTALFTYYFIK